MSPRVRTALPLTVTEEMLQRAYDCSRWTLGNTPEAERAVAMATAHLPEAARKVRERKRKRGKGTVNRVLLDEANRFHFAVLEEVEREEIWQERHGHGLTQEALTRRFLKTPIMFALNHNGYYAIVAMCTAFADYTCGEMQKLYHYAAMDRPKSKADRECGRVNEPLFERLYHRFGHVAAFDPCNDPAKLPQVRREAPTAELLACMREGLALHAPPVPWPVVLPRRSRENPVFSGNRDEAELQRMALFFNPASFDSLAGLLRVDGFDLRAQTIIVHTDSLPTEPEPEPEDDDALTRIRALIDDEIERMQSARAGALRIRVDGIERGRLDGVGQLAPMLLEAHASLVEIVADAADSTEVVVGSYLLTYDGEKDEEWELELPWSDRDRLICSFGYGGDDCVDATFERRRRATAKTRVSAIVPAFRPSNDPLPPIEHPSLQPGSVIADRYQIVHYYGHGSCGETFKAFDASALQRPVVLIVGGACGGTGASIVSSLLEALKRDLPRHPAIVHTYDVFEYDSRPVIAQEFVKGISLRDRLLEAPMSTTDAFDCVTKIVSVVGDLHRDDLFHRDLKPSKIMFCSEGLKILDFGIARRLDRARRWDLCDVSYMAPETRRDAQADARSDVFSIGVMAYEMLTGARPFDRVPPAEINPSLPADLNEVVVRAINPDPDKRYPDANAFRDALLDCRESVQRASICAAREDLALMRLVRRVSCVATPHLLVETIDRLVVLECKAAIEMLTADDERSLSRAREAFERHRSELAWLTERYRDNLRFEIVSQHCFAPQDWRAVVLLARRLAVGTRRAGASEDSIRDLIAASETLLPRLKLRPSLAAVLAILLEKPGTSG